MSWKSILKISRYEKAVAEEFASEELENEKLLRGTGAVTTASAPSLFNVRYGGKKDGEESEEDSN
jgi:hypothetical protein